MSRASVCCVAAVLVHLLMSTSRVHAWEELSPDPMRWRVRPASYGVAADAVGASQGGPGVVAVEAALQASLEAWSSVGTGWSGAYAGRSSRAARDDGRSDVFFVSRWDPALGDASTVLAVASTIGAGERPVFTIREVDILFNGERYDWTSGRPVPRDGSSIASCSVRAVMLHESGHSLGLGHSTVESASMYPSCRGVEALAPDDRAGIEALYPSMTLCSSDGQCRGVFARARCDASLGLCLETALGSLGEACDSATDCAAGLMCRGLDSMFVCTQRCTDDADCSASTYCLTTTEGGLCWVGGPTPEGGACSRREECSTTLCEGSRCVRRCDDDCDCGGGQRCDFGSGAPGGGRCRDGASSCERCGDGRVEVGEECDDGADNSDEMPDRCRTSCRRPYCGDAVVDSGEHCDDGASANGDGCSSACLEEGMDPMSTPDAGGATEGEMVAGDRDAGAGSGTIGDASLSGVVTCAVRPSGGSCAAAWAAMLFGGILARARRRAACPRRREAT